MKLRITLLLTSAWLGCLSPAVAIVQWPATVNNIAELKALSIANIKALETTTNGPSVTPAVYVLGYYAEGDRGGGMFEWDPNSSAIPDDGRYMVTNGWISGNGRWVRRLSGEVANVRMWGAMGNIDGGVLTPGNVAFAHDDTTNIQNAINGCLTGSVSETTAELLIPSGWYKVAGTVIINAQVKLRGETVRRSVLVMPYGINKDILHTDKAEEAIIANDGGAHWGGPVRIEDLTFMFATQSGSNFVQDVHNQANAAIVICQPEEGNMIRNVQTLSGGYGIRCLGGGGAVTAFRDIVCMDAAIAGICIEPTPGATWDMNQVSIIGITGDHRWDESRSNACLVKFVNNVGPATVQDVNTEGIYGGGVIHHQYPAAMGAYDVGNLTLKNCILNQGNSYSDYDGPRNFLVLESAGKRTTTVTMENIHLFGATNLIRDLLSPRDVTAPDSSALGLHQAVVRLPLEYEAYNDGGIWPDGVTRSKWSRLVVGGQAIYSFVPTTTDAWYRILQPMNGAYVLSSKATISSLREVSEFSVNVLACTDTNAVELNVTRTMKGNLWPAPPCVTKVRAGGYQDSTGQAYPFADIYVERAIPPLGISDYNLYQITVACPVYDNFNLSATEGSVFLQNPTAALSSIVPSGCTLLRCVTNSLVR